jgi:hypothetical protein
MDFLDTVNERLHPILMFCILFYLALAFWITWGIIPTATK